ncbi:coagulation factor IXa [Gadus chalcogrammus]|uniref:coagulation factor IXa n=1 Tax=Gadus chalcogrammus TaxID=1042646 RepID=UPI0024C4A328|nr:coagulation factor IXa [Gadus chalcogrammus]
MCESIALADHSMAPVGLLSLLCSLLLLNDGSAAPAPQAPDPGLVFLSGRAADSVLRRQRRHNSGIFEEFMEGDLERECVEERCVLEEAREVFEDDLKTMEFWAGYIDGDQCSPEPCQNLGVCKDLLGSFTCTCPPNFTGSHCEIATRKRCDVNNGDCWHFCESAGDAGTRCSCADGFKLSEDGLDCLPEGDYPCGRDVMTVISDMSRRSLSLLNATLTQNQTTTNTTTTTGSSAAPDTPSAAPSASARPTGSADSAPMLTRSRRGPGAFWADLEEHEDSKRIVGGLDVSPGEIPWQVGLIHRPSGLLFCGGSILSELWVITAAHCLVEGGQDFFVRAGEHNIDIEEGSEQDLEVREEFFHPRYNATVSLYNHDIALLRLQSSIRFSPMVVPICLGPKAFAETLVKDCSPGTVSGWGRLRFQGATSSTLKKVELPFTERADCKDSSSSRITRYMFCAGYEDKAKDSCQGDSGGPHTNRYHDTWFLTGIVSWGEECAMKGKYGVYTRVSHYYRWIRRVMKTHTRMLDLGPDETDEPDP